MPTQAVINWMLLLFLGLIWGSSFLGVKLSLGSFGPISVAAIRVTIAAVILTSEIAEKQLKSNWWKFFGSILSISSAIWLFYGFSNYIKFSFAVPRTH